MPWDSLSLLRRQLPVFVVHGLHAAANCAGLAYLLNLGDKPNEGEMLVEHQFLDIFCRDGASVRGTIQSPFVPSV